MKKVGRTLAFGILVLMFSLEGCTTYTSEVENELGRPTVYSEPGTVGSIAGTGIESQDIISMCDKMVRDMIANPVLGNKSSPPRVIVDAAFLRNESSSQVNLNMIADRLRSGLIRTANGRMLFVGRHYSEMVEKEKKLKDKGVVDKGSTLNTDSVFGSDYRLGGRITSLDARKSGMTSNFTQIVFEMVDLQTGAIVWGGEYSFRKTAGDDVIYK